LPGCGAVGRGTLGGEAMTARRTRHKPTRAKREPSPYSDIKEVDWQAQVIKAVRDVHGDKALVYHTHDSRHSAAGFPDLVILLPGKLIFAELKAEGKELSEDQQAWMDGLAQVERLGWYVWQPHQMSAVLEAITEDNR